VALLAVSAAFGLWSMKVRDLTNQVSSLQSTKDNQTHTLSQTVAHRDDLSAQLGVRIANNNDAKAATQPCADAIEAYVVAFANGATSTGTQAGADAAADLAYKAAQAACGRANVTVGKLTLKTS
jgi:peptidoglycan hydrolase CwlO-like protein